MIIEKTMSPEWLSNTYLVADEPGGHAVLIDTGGPTGPILDRIRELRLSVSHVLCTHHHYDHVAHNADYKQRFECPVCGHGAERELFGDLDLELEDGQELRSGGLAIRALHIPGHTRGQLAFLVNETEIFTGDTLFKGSVGGTRAPGHASFEEIQHSVMEVLMRLPHETAVHPGHTEPTSIGREWEQNPFIRMWRGAEAPGAARCSVHGRPATLLLRARDYDGGTKCWVRFDDGHDQADERGPQSARFDVVPGSSVRDAD